MTAPEPLKTTRQQGKQRGKQPLRLPPEATSYFAIVEALPALKEETPSKSEDNNTPDIASNL
jgi:hypothetical protein